MKNRLAILYFLLLISSISFSQEGFKGSIFIGGLTSQVDGDNYSGYNKFGIDAGISVNLYINKIWSFNTEITYIQKGSTKNDAKNNIYYRLKLHYIEIPLFFTYRNDKIKKIKNFSFDAGAVIGYLFKDGEDKNGYGLIDPDPAMKSFDYNYLLGINYHLNDYWKIGVRFQYSMVPIKDIEGNPFKDLYSRGQYNNLFALNFYRYF